jgi:hypothetical protein
LLIIYSKKRNRISKIYFFDPNFLIIIVSICKFFLNKEELTNVQIEKSKITIAPTNLNSKNFYYSLVYSKTPQKGKNRALAQGRKPKSLRGNSSKKASETLRKKENNSGPKPHNLSKCLTLLEKPQFFKKASDFFEKASHHLKNTSILLKMYLKSHAIFQKTSISLKKSSEIIVILKTLNFLEMSSKNLVIFIKASD